MDELAILGCFHNVSHSYTIDHKQEEQIFNHMSCVLFELLHPHGKLNETNPTASKPTVCANLQESH